MDGGYTIGELADLGRVATSTVRYYERLRLVQPQGRTRGNYRVYGEAAVERVRFIRAARGSGFTLNDISRLLDFRDGAVAPCKEVELLIEHRLLETRRRMDDLRRTESILTSSLQLCRRAVRKDRCAVIESLKVAPTSGPVPSRHPSRRRK